MEKSPYDGTGNSQTIAPKVNFDPDNEPEEKNTDKRSDQIELENPAKKDERLTLKRKPAVEESTYNLGDLNLPGTNKGRKNHAGPGFETHVFKGYGPELPSTGKTIFHEVNPYISKEEFVTGTERCKVPLPGLTEAVTNHVMNDLKNPIKAIQVPLKVTGLKTLATASAAVYFGSKVQITVAQAIIKAATSPPPVAVGAILTSIADLAIDLSVQHADNMSAANQNHTRCMEPYKPLNQLF